MGATSSTFFTGDSVFDSGICSPTQELKRRLQFGDRVE